MGYVPQDKVAASLSISLGGNNGKKEKEKIQFAASTVTFGEVCIFSFLDKRLQHFSFAPSWLL